MKNFTMRYCLIGLFAISAFAARSQNVGINKTGVAPNASAILDLNTGNNGHQGFLAPWASLLSNTDVVTIAAPSTGLLVYNTNAGMTNGNGIGYYYWNGSDWLYLYNSGFAGILTGANNGLSVAGTIVQLGGPIATPAPLLHNSVISGSNFNLDFDLGTYTSGGTGTFLVTNGGLGTPLLSVSSNTPGVGINVNPAVSTLDDNGSFGSGTVKITPAANSNTNLTNAYSTVIATPPAVAATYTLTLPSAPINTRRIYTVIYYGTGLGTIDILSAAGAIMVDGAAVSPFVLTSGSITFQSDGTNWDAVSDWGGGTTPPIGGAGILNYLARWTPNGNTLGTGVSMDNGVSVSMNTTATMPVATQMLTVTGNATAINAIVGNSSITGAAAIKGNEVNPAGGGGYGVEGLISGAGGGFQYAVYGGSAVTAGNGIGVWGQATGGGAAINYGGYFTASAGAQNYGVVVPAGGGNSGFGTITPASALDAGQSFGTGTINIAPAAASSTALTALYSTVIATPSAPATTYTLTLPSATINPRRIYTVLYNGSARGTIDITSPVSGSIVQNGAVITPIALIAGSVVFQSDGANWDVIAVSAGGTLTAANNGLVVTGTTVQLGTNPLIYNTTLPLAGFTLTETSTQPGPATSNFAHQVQNSNGNGTAFAGINTNFPQSNGTGIGLFGQTYQSNGFGIYGINSNTGAGAGVYGTGTTYGVQGVAATSIGVLGTGAEGVEGNGTAYGLYGIGPIAVYGDANNSAGSQGGNFGNNANGCYTYAAYYTGAAYYGIYSNSEIYTSANLVALGGKACIVEDKKGDTKLMYCPEAPEILFEDYGSSKLVNGKIHIDLDTTYALSVTVNDKHPLRVIITMNDECPNNVYVTNRTATGFDVVEMNHGTSGASFTYEVVANRADIKAESWHPAKNFADVRYPSYTIPKQETLPAKPNNNSK